MHTCYERGSTKKDEDLEFRILSQRSQAELPPVRPTPELIKEKAYKLWQANPQDSADHNWFTAQTLLWLDYIRHLDSKWWSDLLRET